MTSLQSFKNNLVLCFVSSKEPRPFPGIVDLFGAGGGLPEYRASLLAGKGFAVMALAYYNYEDLPKGMENLHLEYFEEAVNYLLSHPQVGISEFCGLHIRPSLQKCSWFSRTTPWLVWLSGSSAGLGIKGLSVWSPYRAHAWVVGQVPSRGSARSNHTLMFLSLSFSLPSPLSKNK